MNKIENGLITAILTPTRFHMFDLARALAPFGWEVRVLSGVPPWKVERDLGYNAHSHPWLVVPLFLLNSMDPRLPFSLGLHYLARVELSTWARRHLHGVEVLDALSGWGLEAGRFVQQNGGVYVCNRGSSHILHQQQVMGEEHTRWSVPPSPGFPDWGVKRELAEYATADGIAVPSHFVKRTFVEQGVPPGKVYVCPYGVELSLFKPLPKEDGKFRVLFVGAFSIRKGIGYLLEAVRPLVKAGQIEVWLVGGANPEAGKILADNDDLFINKGLQPRSRLSWYYSQGSVLVLPSIEEGLALVQAQAMACGLPVITSPETGAADLFTDGQEGFIVPSRDPLAIRDKIEWLLANPEGHAAMGQAARQRVGDLGGWQTYGKKCAAMYQELLARKSASP